MNRLVVVSNRVPDLTASAQAGGLAVALGALMQRRGGMWFGWSGHISAAPAGVALTRTEHVDYATIDLTADEHESYYNGFSNAVLWPVLHTLPDLMHADRHCAEVYHATNARMADALVPLLRPNDLVWVHDYHLLPLPALLRARGVHAPIGFFLHVPFPAPDVFSIVPDARRLLRDMLAADMIGFQTPGDRDNFAAAAHRLLGAARLGESTLVHGGNRVRLGVFPVEIDPRGFAELARQNADSAATQRLRASLGDQRLLLGADRLDPTKGLVQRLAAYRGLLANHPELRGQVTMLQIAAASRQDVATYRDLHAALERQAGAINAEFGEPDWTPLRVVARAVPRGTMAGYMRLSRVGLVTPLRDGMNLVAKEFVAAQDPQDPGVLVLSRYAGAARQLTGALLVNPHDPEEMAQAIGMALDMTQDERQDRWHSMWRAIEGTSALAWGRGFVAALINANRSRLDHAAANDPIPMLPAPAEPISLPLALH